MFNMKSKGKIKDDSNGWQTIENVPFDTTLNLACTNNIKFYGWTKGERNDDDYSLIFYDTSTGKKSPHDPSFWKYPEGLPAIKFDLYKYYESRRPIPKPPLVWEIEDQDTYICTSGEYKGYKICRRPPIREWIIINDRGFSVRAFFEHLETAKAWFIMEYDDDNY